VIYTWAHWRWRTYKMALLYLLPLRFRCIDCNQKSCSLNSVYKVNSNKNWPIPNRSRVSCAHNTSRASIVTPWLWNLG